MGYSSMMLPELDWGAFWKFMMNGVAIAKSSSYKYQGAANCFQDGMVQHTFGGLTTTCRINILLSYCTSPGGMVF